MQRREILIMPVHGGGDIVCRGGLYLFTMLHVHTLRRPEARTGLESFKRFLPSASPPRARADLISLTHGSLRACFDASKGCRCGVRATVVDVRQHWPLAPFPLPHQPSSGVTVVSPADPADKPRAHGKAGHTGTLGPDPRWPWTRKARGGAQRSQLASSCYPVPVRASQDSWPCLPSTGRGLMFPPRMDAIGPQAGTTPQPGRQDGGRVGSLPR